MLKIKDNIDLKELEKFGFKKQPRPYKGYYLCIARGCKIVFILSKEAGNRIMIDKWHYDDPRVHKQPNCKYRSGKMVEDVIYELTKANLIEQTDV